MSEQADNQTTNLLLLSERQQEASLMPEPRRRAVAIASCLRLRKCDATRYETARHTTLLQPATSLLNNQ